MGRQAEELGFAHWVPLAKLVVGDLPAYGACPALYALSSMKTGLCYKLGETGSLRQRLFVNFIGGHGGETTKYIHQKLFLEGCFDDVEVSWTEAASETSTRKAAEGKLRTEFRRLFGGRPLWARES